MEPNTVFTLTPGKVREDLLHSCQFVQVAKVQGVCEEWIVYAPVEADKVFVVLNAPTDGPLQMFQAFSKMPLTCPAFSFEAWDDYTDTYEGVLRYVTDLAVKSVRQENE